MPEFFVQALSHATLFWGPSLKPRASRALASDHFECFLAVFVYCFYYDSFDK